MAWVVTTVGISGLALAALCFAAAVVVHASGRGRLQNRLLALVLAGRGALSLGGIGLMYLTDDPASSFAWQIAAWAAFVPVPWLYLAFLSTIDTPFAAALARARPFFYGAAVTMAAWCVLDPRAFVVSVAPGAFAPWDVAATGPGRTWAISVASIVCGVAGIAVSLVALARAPRGSAKRAQAAAYVAAFAFFDAQSLVPSMVELATATFPLWLIALEVALSVGFVLSLAYAALKTQLFDIDLKVKWTLRRGTIASAFVGVFFVATAVADNYLDRYGALAGGVAAGLLLFALRPIERVADRLADTAMPAVRDTAEYRLVKKREVYRAAVDGALEDGGVSDKERAMLARLASQLALDPLEMHEIEREARAARSVA